MKRTLNPIPISNLKLAIALFSLSVSAWADGSAPAAYKALGKTLTPFGAERQGNTEGTIPSWPSKPVDHETEQPLFVITAANYRQHEKYLTDGQKALFAHYPDSFRMPVYPSNRDTIYPQRLMDATIAQAGTAHIKENGYGLTAAKGAVPFPIPQSGIEAIWNHLTRFRGASSVREAQEAVIEPNGAV